MKRLENKVAIITGATSGIGKAMAVLFAAEGAKVVFAGRRVEQGKAVEKEIQSAGNTAFFCQADVGKKADLQALVDFTIGKFGRIDVLCNNAGILFTAEFTEMDLEKDFDRTMDINVKSYISLMQLVIPHMKKTGGGSIVNTASIGAVQALPMNVSYSVSKAAVKHLTESTAVRYARDKIRVNAICPGLTYSEMVEKGNAFDQHMMPLIPLGRGAEAVEIAQGALFLASDDSSYCVGVSLIMDGGLILE
ncbi:MAG: SDR family oxidoreductase [Treponema sp.]|nr:SDR family oxidoreductase [Treponema sp.]